MKTVTEIVESGLGAPDPEELARIEVDRRNERLAERQEREEGNYCAIMDSSNVVLPGSMSSYIPICIL